jgi:hypothetical protein
MASRGWSYAAWRSARLWRKAVRGEHVLLISPAIIREVVDMLRQDLKWPEPEIIAEPMLVVCVAKIAEHKLPLEVIAADPDDEPDSRMRGCRQC